MHNKKKYTSADVFKASLEYFDQDELAAKVFTDKYALQDNDNNFYELTPKDMHIRLAKEFARIQNKKYINSKTIQPLTEEELFNLFDRFKYIVPQGSPMFGIGNNFQTISLANCFVLTTPNDSYASILHTDEELVQISKRRGGVGIDLSNLRPAGAKTNNAAKTSTGVLSFMERYSNSIREVGQSGRRGALMLTLDCHHPDIENFIAAKVDRTKVTGANISIRLSDEFLNAVENNEKYEQRFPVDYKEKNIEPKISKMISAKKVWDLIVENAWENAEPGILFWDNIIKYGTADCYTDVGFKTVSTNPCVVGDTLVLTNIGWIKIKNLQQYKNKYSDLKIITTGLNFSGEEDIFESELEWVGITHKDSNLMKIEFDNYETLLVTPEHKLYLFDFSEIMVKDLKVGNKIIGKNSVNLRTILNIEKYNLKEDVWDLTANPNYNFSSILNKDEFIDEQIIIVNDRYKFKSFDVINTWMNSKFANQLEIGDEIVYPYKKNITVKNIVKKEITNDYFGKSILSVDCAEIALSETDACRLLLLNTYSYVNNPFTDVAHFDIELFSEHVKISQRLMDDLVDLEVEKIDQIIGKINNDPEDAETKSSELKLWNKIKISAINGRRTGLGITGLGDTIAALGFGYGTIKGIHTTKLIYQMLRDNAYESSIEMAKELGAFPVWDYEKEKNNAFLKRLKDDIPKLYNDMQIYGRRNIALLTTAPAGSLSLLSQTTSGIEPAFMLKYTRRKKILTGDDSIVNFVDDKGDKWQEFTVYHPKVKTWMDITNETDITKSPWYNNCAEDLNWEFRVKLQASAQYYIDHSISSTANLPENVTKETVSEIYKSAWKHGCKGFTVYRSGSRTGVMVENKKEIFKKHDAIKRPKELNAEVHHFKIDGSAHYVTVGLLENEPYEIFVGKNNEDIPEVFIPKTVKFGKVVKMKRGEYILNTECCSYLISGENFSDEIEALNRMVSISLRHGIDISYIVHQLEKTKGILTSYTKALARTLKRYIKDGSFVSGESCPECNQNTLIRQDGCKKCTNCGYAACG